MERHNERPLGRRDINLQANFFPAKISVKGITQYDVIFESEDPKLAEVDLPRTVQFFMLRTIFPKSTRFFFDGKSVFLFGSELPDAMLTIDKENPIKHSVSHCQDPFQAIIRKAVVKEGREDNIEFSQAMLNNILHHVITALKWKKMGRYEFDVKNPIEPPSLRNFDLRLFKGLKTVLVQTEFGLALNSDILFKVCHTVTVLHMMEKKWHKNRDLILDNLLGTIVLTLYNNETYLVEDVLFEESPMSLFSCGKKGQEEKISFQNYYQRVYNITIKNVDQPLLKCITTRRGGKHRSASTGIMEERACMLVPELCALTGVPEDLIRNRGAMTSLKEQLSMPVQKRCQAITQAVSNLVKKDENELQRNPELRELNKKLEEWNLEISPSMVTLEGQVIPRCKLLFGDNTNFSPNHQGSWRFLWTQEKPVLFRPPPLERWIIFSLRENTETANQLISVMRELATPMGIAIEPPQRCLVSRDTPAAWMEQIREDVTREKNLQLAVCLLPNDSENRYSAIKSVFAIERPIPAQCVCVKSVCRNDNKSVVTGLLGQIQAKIGGAPWAVELARDYVHTMVVGIDITHFSDKESKKSVVGFTASLDNFTRYYSEPLILEKGAPISVNLRGCLERALKAYQLSNNQLPVNIVVYRTSVGEGQVNALLLNEVADLQLAFQDFPEYNPGFTFLLVAKRTTARFFQRGMENPPPGTVIDHGCIPAGSQQFFLISQGVNQGTVSPTRYVVVTNSTKFSKEQFQQLTYSLCHLYYNYSGTIAVPAPLHYAGKLATMIGGNVRKPPHEATRRRLFYL